MPRRILAAGVLCALFLTACEDPSNVGIGLVGEGEGNPFVVRLAPSPFTNDSLRDVTGNRPRVLAGRVDDPLFGTVEATGYVDFSLSNDNDGVSDFREGTLSSARLELAPDYRYGDTTGTITLALRDMPEDWDANGARADTTLEAGDLIVEATFAVTDSVFAIDLPATWVAQNDTTLRSSSVGTSFNGFQVSASMADVVVGFGVTRTRLRAIAGEDTVFFDGSESLSSLNRLSEPTLPDGRIALQDGVGPNIRFDVVLPESLFTTAINRTVLELPVDTVTTQATPPGFVRPRISTVELVGLGEDGDVVLAAQGQPLLSLGASVNDDGALVFNQGELRVLLQEEALRNELTITQFGLRGLLINNTISTLLFYDTGAADRAPAAVLTVTPLN